MEEGKEEILPQKAEKFTRKINFKMPVDET
jgi:hypothetical protein